MSPALVFTKLTSAALFALALIAAPALAQDGLHHDYHASLFAGAASASGATHVAAGLDIERRLSLADGLFGVGPVVEFTFADHTQTLAAAGIFIHPLPSLKFVVAPGLEIAEGHSAFLMRLGTGYDVHLTNTLSLTPSFNVDLVSGHAIYVYGLGFGMGF